MPSPGTRIPPALDDFVVTEVYFSTLCLAGATSEEVSLQPRTARGARCPIAMLTEMKGWCACIVILHSCGCPRGSAPGKVVASDHRGLDSKSPRRSASTGKILRRSPASRSSTPAPFALFRTHEERFLKLFCRPHNRPSAERVYGTTFIQEKTEAPRRHRQEQPG